MRSVLIVVGKTTNQHLSVLIDDYLQRTKHYVPLLLEVVPDVKNSRATAPSVLREREGEQLLRRITEGDFVVLLDETGQEMRSTELAQMLGKKMQSGARRLVFIIGGAFGFAPALYQRADAKLSLSRLTFTHQMVRLFFVEQYYRAMTILRGESYHNE